jgi:hypothetical protein
LYSYIFSVACGKYTTDKKRAGNRLLLVSRHSLFGFVAVEKLHFWLLTAANYALEAIIPAIDAYLRLL